MLHMKPIRTAGLLLAVLAAGLVAQDWYQARVERFHGDEWRPQLFNYVRTDLEHVWSADVAADRERTRLAKTKEEHARCKPISCKVGLIMAC
jgi:hypothetical protein